MTGKREERQIELLAPAGSYETFLAVIHAGADAVYLGGSHFGARAYANNFGEEELLSAIDYAHIHGRKVYLTVNTLFKETEIEEGLYSYLLPYYRQGLDAVIVQDMGALSLIRQAFPGLAIHTSTQMTVTGRYGAAYMKKLGASRMVTAREMSFGEIQEIRDHVDIEIESFVHGALCYGYSGQCLFSSILGGRSGNRGRCAQPCRLPYEVYDAKRRKIAKDAGYILSPKDLCTIEYLPELVECGVSSFKIEGRMKQAEYAAGVVSIYREYINRCLEDRESYHVEKCDLQKLWELGNRSGFTDGYYFRQNGKDMITLEKSNHTKSNEELQTEIRDTYIRREIKEKIKGTLRLKKDFPAALEVVYGDIRIIETGQLVQAALKQPLSSEKVANDIKKTGSTPFEFEDLQIEMDEEVFLPVQAMKQLRRDALSQLEDTLTEKYRRKEGECVPHEVGQQKGDELQSENIAVSIERREQLFAAISCDFINDVYLDSSCYRKENLLEALREDIADIHQKQKKAYYMLPTVFRSRTAIFYEQLASALRGISLDGIVVGSYDAAEFVKCYFGEDFPILLNHSLYTYNGRAKELLGELHPQRDTAPLELNRRELMRRDNRNSEILIYGNLPLMTSAQCVHANVGKCDKTSGFTYLKDRYGKFFPVKNNCTECCNTIYNTTPLILFGFREDFRKMGMKAFRISFTTETKEEAEEILYLCRETFLMGKREVKEAFCKEYTNGHYKRGVE